MRATLQAVCALAVKLPLKTKRWLKLCSQQLQEVPSQTCSCWETVLFSPAPQLGCLSKALKNLLTWKDLPAAPFITFARCSRNRSCVLNLLSGTKVISAVCTTASRLLGESLDLHSLKNCLLQGSVEKQGTKCTTGRSWAAGLSSPLE